MEVRMRSMLVSLAVVFAAHAAFAQPTDDPETSDDALAIVNARLVDGTGAPARHTSIGIRDGVIASLGDAPPESARVLDAEGLTVLPGLIDSHVHFQAVPGAVHRKDDAETRRALMHRHLRAHVANGVTTVLDGGDA